MHFMTREPTNTNLSDLAVQRKLASFHLQLFLIVSLAHAICFIQIWELIFGGFRSAINRLYNIHPLFTACRTFCCKIFPVKLSAVLATRLPLTVWWHEAGVSGPASPAHRQPNNCPVPEPRQYPANFRAWLQTSVKHFYSLSQTTLANVSKCKLARLLKSIRNTANAVILHEETVVC